MAKKHAGGRPTEDTKAVLVSFKADLDTLAAIDALQAALNEELGVGALVNGGKSQAIRKALLESAARLDTSRST